MTESSEKREAPKGRAWQKFPFLVGGWTTHLKNMLVKMGSSSPRIGLKIKNVWNHHLAFVFRSHFCHGTNPLCEMKNSPTKTSKFSPPKIIPKFNSQLSFFVKDFRQVDWVHVVWHTKNPAKKQKTCWSLEVFPWIGSHRYSTQLGLNLLRCQTQHKCNQSMHPVEFVRICQCQFFHAPSGQTTIPSRLYTIQPKCNMCAGILTYMPIWTYFKNKSVL